MGRLRFSALTALVGIVLTAHPAAAAITATITSVPVEITQPGTYYVSQDLTYTGTGTAITIHAGGVDVYFTNHQRLTGTGSGTGIEIGQGVDNVRVNGPTISRFTTGVFIGNANAKVTNCIISQVAYGIYRNFGHGSTVAGNIISAPTGVGILVGGQSDASLISNNSISNSGGHAIVVQGYRNQIIQNTLTDSALNGIWLLSYNPGPGDAGEEGRNIVRGNNCFRNRGYGIEVGWLTWGNTIERNVALTSGIADLFDGYANTRCRNVWRNNRFTTDNEAGSAQGPFNGCIQ